VGTVPKVTQEHLDARRTQILEGAARAFAQYGYEGATVARLEEATGLSRGAIFHYFGGKQDLFFEVAADVNRRFVGVIQTGGLGEALREIAKTNPQLLAVLFETQARLLRDEEFMRRMEEASDELRPALETWFSEQRESGALRTDMNWTDLARFATMVTNGLGLRIVMGDPTDVDSVVRLLEDALRPQPA
jgi:AcrR family transcriptional regulator